MNILGIIPTRGGSKGLQSKNLKVLTGKPLIAWTIEAAKASEHISRVVVTTDSVDIAKSAKQHGAEVPFMRPLELAGDLSTAYDVVMPTLLWLEENENYSTDLVVLLPPTAPLLAAEDIDRGIETLQKHPKADSLRPIIESSKHPFTTFTVEIEYLKPLFRKRSDRF